MVEFSQFDSRKYPTLDVREGYRQWAPTYEDTVLDLMDQRLLARLTCVDWSSTGRAVDLACGTGRTGAWLKQVGIRALDGVDMTKEMLVKAQAKQIYDRLYLGDIRATGLDALAYDLAIVSLADEHLSDVAPMYTEVARLTREEGHFVVVGYHPPSTMVRASTAVAGDAR